MASKVAELSPSQEIPNCDDARLPRTARMAQAQLRVTPSHKPLRTVIRDVLRGSPVKKEALSAAMEKDRAQMYRQIDNGHLTVEDLEAIAPDVGVALGHALLDAYGPHATPLALALQRLHEARQILDAVEEHLMRIEQKGAA